MELTRRAFMGAVAASPAVVAVGMAAPEPIYRSWLYRWRDWKFFYTERDSTFWAYYKHTNGISYGVSEKVSPEMGQRLLAGAKWLSEKGKDTTYSPWRVWIEYLVKSTGCLNYLVHRMLAQLIRHWNVGNTEEIAQVWRHDPFGKLVADRAEFWAICTLDYIQPFRLKKSS